MTGSMLRGLPFVVDDIGLGQDVSRYRINLVCSERARSLEWHRPPHIIKQRGGVGPYRRVCGLGCRRSALLVLAAFLPVFLRSGCHVLPVMKSRRRTAFPWLGTPAFGTNAAEAEDSADPACEHAVACKLIELTTLEVFVLPRSGAWRQQGSSRARVRPSARHARRRWLPRAHPRGVRPAE